MNISDQPSIFIGNIMVSEPITTLTDLMITVTCVVCFIRLSKKSNTVKAKSYMQYYLLFIGLSTFLAGIFGHCFNHILGFEWKLPGWIASIVAIGLLERAALEHSRALIHERVYRRLKVFNVVEIILFGWIAIATMNFLAVVVQTAFVMVFVVLVLQIYTYQRTGDKGCYYMLIAIAVAALSAFTFIFEISISKWFNHADLSHIIIAISAYFYYLSAKNMLTQRHLQLLYARY